MFQMCNLAEKLENILNLYCKLCFVDCYGLYLIITHVFTNWIIIKGSAIIFITIPLTSSNENHKRTTYYLQIYIN